MTHEQIIEIMIRACEIDRKLPNTARPARLKAMNIGFVHTFAEMNHWHAEDLHAANWAWLDPANLRATTKDMLMWEVAMEMIKLVPDPKKRRALWAWSRAQAGGVSFSRWCRDIENPGISRQAGEYRQRSAVECIFRAFARKPLQHNELREDGDFTNGADLSDKRSSIAVWRAPDAKPMACDFDKNLERFEWADMMNARRRQRDAEKRRQRAA